MVNSKDYLYNSIMGQGDKTYHSSIILQPTLFSFYYNKLTLT